MNWYYLILTVLTLVSSSIVKDINGSSESIVVAIALSTYFILNKLDDIS